jgi:hypothetical protein
MPLKIKKEMLGGGGGDTPPPSGGMTTTVNVGELRFDMEPDEEE